MHESDDAKAARKRSEETQEMLQTTLPAGSVGRVKIEAKHRANCNPPRGGVIRSEDGSSLHIGEVAVKIFPGKPEVHSISVGDKQIWPEAGSPTSGPRWTCKWETHPRLGYTILDAGKPVGVVSHGVTKEGVDFMLKLFNKHYGYGENT